MYDSHASDRRVSSFISGVYGWMSCALALTAGIAYYVQSIPSFATLQQPGIMFGLLLAQLIFVMLLVFLLNRLSYVAALLLFLLYAASLGVTLSPIFYVYTTASIVSTFVTTAATFFLMSLYGLMTKSDLTTIGNLSAMALLGLIVSMIVNMFLKSETFDYILAAFGVIIFVLLTAYDTQKIKQIGRSVSDDQVLHKLSLLGALTLYLDFINLFLSLLRLFGQRNEK